MLNLLFISDSPKTEQIKSVLQPELRVIIDVVSDFDHGLKDVFEKRPATVCIQDQIGGVTGESVARHIQMLLGASAPTFILLHSGNGKARTINGLFEHLVDLNQANDVLSGEIKGTLKSLLGDQWEKIYIPPKLAPAAVRSSVALPEGSREDADKLVDDFISDLETSGFIIAGEQPPVASDTEVPASEESIFHAEEPSRNSGKVAATVEEERAQAISDDLAELLIMEASKVSAAESAATASSNREEAGVVAESPKVAPVAEASAPVVPEPALVPDVPSEGSPVSKTKSQPPVVASPPKKRKTVNSASGAEPQAAQPPVVPAAAEFRISQDFAPEEEHIPADLLLAFEENYRSESPLLRRVVVIALVCVVCAAGGWFLVTQKPQLLADLKQRIMLASTPKQAPPAPPTSPDAPKPPVAAVVPPPVAVPSLPSFVPQDGHDPSYAAKNPGWERYAGKNAEFRLFSASGRMKALQVIALKGSPLSESYIKSVLQEFTGTSGYQTTSSSVKAGVHVENGKVQDKAEVKIYRKNGVVKAFVVSVN